MGDSLRREVLHTFKKLHRTRMNIFKNDEHAMTVTRHKINEEYRKYLHITNPAAIQELKLEYPTVTARVLPLRLNECSNMKGLQMLAGISHGCEQACLIVKQVCARGGTRIENNCNSSSGNGTRKV
ncbi:uncharacterized protein LOC143181649 isoform X3 [Calliopsis andreniformis]